MSPEFPKPDIPDAAQAQWQRITNLIATICRVPVALVMKVHSSEIEVFVTGRADGNPYERGERAQLNTGLYCENVMAKKEKLLVANALDDPMWDNNPDLELGMISYLGYPLIWPDGEVFGTLCVLDRKANIYSRHEELILEEFKAAIETSMALLLENDERRRAEAEKANLVIELREALAEVKKLSGMLPICASCKRIRDDKGYWQQIEGYIQEHSEAEFSHSICPECTRKLYPEICEDE
jgi:GAF domain-containing protein